VTLLPLPPPPRLDKSLGDQAYTDRQVVEGSLVDVVDHKVVALHAYRRACDLCQYCIEKWSKGHKCAPTVQLQAVQEL
jgi:hypothetical protein